MREEERALVLQAVLPYRGRGRRASPSISLSEGAKSLARRPILSTNATERKKKSIHDLLDSTTCIEYRRVSSTRKRAKGKKGKKKKV